jgi:preprotein translocase SecE subunit
MNWAQELVKTISGLELSPNLSYVYIAFILVTIGFIVWAYYFAVFQKGIRELGKITWFPFKSTVSYTILTVFVIVIFGAILFGYDFILDQLLNIIVSNAR